LFLFAISCKNNKQEDMPKPSTPKDSSLKFLVVKQGEATLHSSSSPVPKNITVQLIEKVSDEDFIEVACIPNDSSCKIMFDSDEKTSNTKRHTSFVNEVVIKAVNGDAVSEYKVMFLRKKEIDLSLASLEIKQTGSSVKTFNADVPKSMSFELTKKISESDFVELKATPTDSNVSISIDGEEINTKKYTSLPNKAINITVFKDDDSNVYTLTLSEKKNPDPPDPPITDLDPYPEPEDESDLELDPPIPDEYTIYCNVIDSVGGSNIKGVAVNVYEAGKSDVIKTQKTDSKGNAYFNIPKGKCYDFVLSKRGRAASRVENVYVDSTKKMIPIPMLEWAVGAKAIAPIIGKVDILNYQTNETTLLTTDIELDMAQMEFHHYLNLTTTSLSGEIIPLKKDGSGNFSISMNIDSPFGANEGWGKIPATRFEINGSDIAQDAQGNKIQEWGFSLGSMMVADGEATLYFICYDQAGNRCERQEQVVFKNASIKDEINTEDHFELFQAISKRYYRSLKLFGMPKEDGEATSLNVVFYFKFNNHIEVGRVDIFRRPYSEEDITQGWKKVYTKQYKRGYKGEKMGQEGYFRLQDDSGSLEEGKEYQYKLIAHTKKGKIESDVATLRMMEAFNILLTSPAPREVVKLKDIKTKDFSFRISNHALWDKEKADDFYFDVLIATDITGGEGSTNGLCFSSKIKYSLQGDEQKKLYIGDGNKKYKLFSEISTDPPTLHKESDLITYNDGIVTLKSLFMNTKEMTLTNLGLENSITFAGMFYWDVQSFAGKSNEDALSPANKAAYFVKRYPYLDNKTGGVKDPNNVATSYSCANLDAGSGAKNGRSLFIVKN